MPTNITDCWFRPQISELVVGSSAPSWLSFPPMVSHAAIGHRWLGDHVACSLLSHRSDDLQGRWRAVELSSSKTHVLHSSYGASPARESSLDQQFSVFPVCFTSANAQSTWISVSQEMEKGFVLVKYLLTGEKKGRRTQACFFALSWHLLYTACFVKGSWLPGEGTLTSTLWLKTQTGRRQLHLTGF